jgi:hypothetical protein
MASTHGLEGIEAVFRTIGDQPSLWESLLPEEVPRLPAELARVDALLDDPAFFAPFVRFFDPLNASTRPVTTVMATSNGGSGPYSPPQPGMIIWRISARKTFLGQHSCDHAGQPASWFAGGVVRLAGGLVVSISVTYASMVCWPVAAAIDTR